MKKQNRGISLISLIITIIVIIILAAIVIFSGMGTPEKAQLSAVISDIDNVQTAVDQAYYGLYTEKSVAGEVWTKSQFYEAVATGETNRDNLTGTGIVPISEDGMVQITLPNYEGRSWGVAVEDIDENTQVGSVVLYPGFESNGKIYSTLLDVQNDGRNSQLADGIQDNTATTIKNNLKIGDYVLYEGDTNNSYTLDSSLTGYASENGKELKPETTTWRVWDKKADGTIIIMPTSSVNTFTLCGAIGFVNSVDVIENICDIYANETYGVTANDIRSLKIEDLEDERVSSNMKTVRYNYEKDSSHPQYGKTNVDKYGGNGYTSGKFYTEKDGVTIIKEPNVASSTNPIVLTQTYYHNGSPIWNKCNESGEDTYGTLLGSSLCTLASPCVILYSSFACFALRGARSSVVDASSFYTSGGLTISLSLERGPSASFSGLYAPNRCQRYSKRWKHIRKSMEVNQEVRFCASGLFVRLRDRHNFKI